MQYLIVKFLNKQTMILTVDKMYAYEVGQKGTWGGSTYQIKAITSFFTKAQEILETI